MTGPLSRSLLCPGIFRPWCLFALMLGLAGCGGLSKNLALPKVGGPIPVSGTHEPTEAERAYWDQLAPARVIYVSETHNSNADHMYQWEVLKGLEARGDRLTVGWEMFDRTQQPLLDAWNARRLSTDALLNKTDFQRHWGTYSVLYEKILRWSLGEGIPSLALNAPNDLAHQMAAGQPLSPEQRDALPTGFQPLSGGYEHFAAQMGDNPHVGANLENFYQAQILWDQTMASRIVEFLGSHSEGKLVVLIGRGHVEGGFGVPAYVSQKTDVAQLVVYPSGAPTDNPSKPAGQLAKATAKTPVRLAWTTRSSIVEPSGKIPPSHAPSQTR